MDYTSQINELSSDQNGNIENGAANQITIAYLNDDCLEEIFRRLHIQEQIRLSQCNDRFETVFVKYICNKYPKHLNNHLFVEILKLTDNDMLQFWRCYGEYAESIEMNSERCGEFVCSPIMYEAINQHCTNLKRLKLMLMRSVPVGKTFKFINAMNMQTITKLEIVGCDLEDCDIERLTTMRNLRALNLTNDWGITGKSIIHMRQLQYLSLGGLEQVTQETLVEICKALDLRFLDIRFIFYPNLNAIVEHCSELESLQFSVNKNPKTYQDIVKIPKLKTLFIHQFWSIPESFFDLLAVHRGNDLLELKIWGGDRESQSTRPIELPALYLRRFCKLRTVWICRINKDPFAYWQDSTYIFAELEEINIATNMLVEDSHILPIVQQCTNLKLLRILDPYWHFEDSLVRKIVEVLECRAKAAGSVKASPLLFVAGCSYVEYNIVISRLYNPLYWNARHLLWVALAHTQTVYQGSAYEKRMSDIATRFVHYTGVNYTKPIKNTYNF